MWFRDNDVKVPIIQGGMGVGVSMSNLAGNVALCGGIGVISSVNAGYREPDFMTNPMEANLRALEAEIKKAKEIAKGNGLIAVNIMTAVSRFSETALCAVKAGADMIISGAGLPLKLPEYTKGTDTLCVPIVSSGRGARLLTKTYMKKYGVTPDAFIIEGHDAGGHLGFSKDEIENDTAKDNHEILAEVLEEVKDYNIPVFVGGGVFDGNDMASLLQSGAAGVQIGTRFIATEECDAADGFKEVIVNATEDDVRIIKSPVGMPARAIESPLLKKLSEGLSFPAKICNGCLDACPKGVKASFCISRALVAAVRGNYEEGLFFSGSNVGRIRGITTVKALMDEIMDQCNSKLEGGRS